MLTIVLLAVTRFLISAISVCGQDYEYIGFGVGSRTVSDGANIFIGYPGWSVSETLGRHWVDRLVAKSELITKHGVGHVYAVKGPDDPGYEGQEIENSALIRDLLTRASVADKIIVAAHSSGAFVANEFFTQLYDWGADQQGATSGKIIYFDLDGAGGFSAFAESQMKNLFFVYAQAPGIQSMNADAMIQLANDDSQMMIALDASGSGCLNQYCLHDVMIIQTPWDPTYFDLESDYGLFSVGEREVQMEYLEFVN